MERRKLGEILIDAGVIDEHQLEIAIAERDRVGGRLGRILVDLGLATEDAISRALASQSGVEHCDLDRTELDPAALALVPEDVARRLQLIPVRLEDDSIVVAMAVPTNIVAIDEVERIADRFVRVVSASRRQVFRTIDRAYAEHGQAANTLERAIRAATAELESEDSEGGSHGVIALFDEILAAGIRRETTDVHLEPDQNVVRVRYRIDGALVQGPTLPVSLAAPFAARAKVMAGMNIAESRLPQDGKIRFDFEGRKIDLRVSTFPSVHGESVVLRVLDTSRQQFSLANLGLSAVDQARLRHGIARPNGLILAAGPTGSGKTTTLYALLRAIDCTHRKVITLEDPVEYGIPLVTQCQINEKAGLTFGTGLRSILRHDPDVILVGEMRDSETASLALRASLTGHLVLSTLHTNDAVRTISRLRDMGAEPFLIASCLEAVIAQRLVRRVCADCAGPYDPDPVELEALGFAPGTSGKFAKGMGCDRCNETGVRGREAVFEILPVTSEVAHAIAEEAPLAVLQAAALSAGMRSFQHALQQKALEGRIPLEELAQAGTEA